MKATVYVDGSFNASSQVYGSGAVFFLEGADKPLLLSQPGNFPPYLKARNVAGEVMAVILVLKACERIPNLEELTIYYDYAGLECWAKGLWRANSPIAQMYKEAVSNLPYKLSFRKVKAHSGNTYNEQADALAKAACGL